MSELTSRLALPLIAASQAQKHVPVNEALTRLDSLVQLAVLERSLSSPPPSPANGDRYIVGPGATGAWVGHDSEIAAYDAGWLFAEPLEGWRAWDAAEQELVVFTEGSWAVVTSGSGGSDGGDFQNIELLGIGGEADETNPFSAKLNNALWTSKAASEGGTGDLRYVLNKEASANVLSLLFQSAYGDRAELGLIGDEDFLFKVSADGSAWLEALRIDRTTGRLHFPQGGIREQLTASRTYYVRTDGSDSNSGLANSSGGAFATIQKAIDVVAGLDLSIYDATIQIADGTYTVPNVLKSLVGAGKCVIRGNLTTPANVLISVTGHCFDGVFAGHYHFEGIKVAASGAGIQAAGGAATVSIGAMDFGSCGQHMNSLDGALFQLVASYAISGSATRHVFAQRGGKVVGVTTITVTLTGSPVFSSGFAMASIAGIVLIHASFVTWSGSVGGGTSRYYNVASNATINTGGGGATWFPGNTAGIIGGDGSFA